MARASVLEPPECLLSREDREHTGGTMSLYGLGTVRDPVGGAGGCLCEQRGRDVSASVIETEM